MLIKVLPRQKGFSLIELMISLSLGLVVVGGALSIVVSMLTTNTSMLKATRLNQELRAVMMMLTHDLRRAGSWGLTVEMIEASHGAELTLSATSGSSVTFTGNSSSTFDLNVDASGTEVVNQTLKHVSAGGQVGLADITGYTNASRVTADITDSFPSTTVSASTWVILNPFSDISVNADKNCILFHYDEDSDGLLGSGEYYGFRLDTVEHAIEARQGSALCTDPGWENITDEGSIEITALAIEPSTASLSANGFNVTVRQYRITLIGRLEEDPAVQRTLRETVKVRNNKAL